ncbi:MAG: hypothetical protein A2Z49_01115 [Chloroflexi bacterium RBG_19FT_COMBO_56_12]|nr:MAG: hypothetical protein A2Z49_01115 [Chloroflexi bacterium RBG_19FT_COMBO_56_12]
MGKINTIFFWLGGVITQTIPESAIFGLYNQPVSKLNYENRMRLLGLAQDLSLGRINSRLFCQRTLELSGIVIAAEELEARIKKSVTVRIPVLEAIKELPDAYNLWLISDYPPEWVEQFANHSDLYLCFHPNQVIFTSESHLVRMDPDIFYYSVCQATQPMDACLMVDGMSARAVHSVMHGLSSAIFMDTARLKREFALRRMIP